ncbi:MAG: dienelactone hydrolase family protein [Candidatus Puniceispirillum sp.]|nr:dienelactone hydrolase family protein [Candidatus Puniceispirillum sp.]
MGNNVILTAVDGHQLDAYLAAPAATPKGAVVVIQEIFGVNPHIREVTDRFAAAGYLAIAPALFDRIGPAIALAYDADGVAEGRRLKEQADANSQDDVKAAIDFVASAGRVGAVGFCWGGSLAWRMACDRASGLGSAVSYYGGELPTLAGRDATCPVMAHFGLLDASIPEQGARSFAAAQPNVETYFYDAGHGFNCDHRGQYDAAAAAMAWGRTMAFLENHLT